MNAHCEKQFPCDRNSGERSGANGSSGGSRNGAPIRVAHVVMTAYGGAARAAYNLHKTLCGMGVDSHFLVCESANDWPGAETLLPERVPMQPFWKALNYGAKMLWLLSGRPARDVDFQLKPQGYLPQLDRMGYDLIHLHWVNGAVASLAEIGSLRTPIVWTLHDMSAFMGVHFYLGPNLEKWMNARGEMRAVDAETHLLARMNVVKKAAIYKGKKVGVIAPCRWMADCAAESGVFAGFPIRTIPYDVPHAPWQLQDRQSAREKLGLPADAAIVLFGADTISIPRKGGDLLLAAFGSYQDAAPAFPANVLLLSFGRGVISGMENQGIPYRALGMIHDQDQLASLYAAADVFVAPSREDNLPNVVLESLASGTPVVAFRIGGMPDMIEDGRTGKLAKPFSTASLRDAISEVLGWAANHALACRESVSERFSPHQQGTAVLRLYSELLS